jgi:hypothetical protein
LIRETLQGFRKLKIDRLRAFDEPDTAKLGSGIGMQDR